MATFFRLNDGRYINLDHIVVTREREGVFYVCSTINDINNIDTWGAITDQHEKGRLILLLEDMHLQTVKRASHE